MTRRRFGRATLLPSGRWHVRYTAEGRAISAGTYPTERAARNALTDIESEINRGVWVDPTAAPPVAPPTFADALAAYIEFRQDRGKLRESTAEGYRSIARTWLGVDGDRPTGFGAKRVDDITRADCNALVSRMGNGDTKRDPATIRNVIRLVATVLRYAEREAGWIDRNPAEGVTLPSARRNEMLCLTEAQVLVLAAAFPRPDHGTLIKLTVFGGGLRAGEVAGLRVGDFDADTGELTIERARKRVKGTGVEYVPTKTEAGERKNNLPGWLAAEVAALCAGRPADAPMFRSVQDTAHDHGNFMRRWFKPAVARAGLPERLRFHDLRHTAASLALARGVPVVDVAATLGHSKPTTTLSIYGHVVPDQRGRFAAAFENVGRPALKVVS